MVLVRSFIAFVGLLIFARVLGKQQVSQLTFFEYVTGISIGSIAAALSIDLSIRGWPIYVGLITWALLTFAVQLITLKWRWGAKILAGEPVMVMKDGKVLEANMGQARLRFDELTELLRQQKVYDLTQVEYAILEPSGKLSVKMKPEEQPIARKDVGFYPPSSGVAVEVIEDGRIIPQNLSQLGLTIDWLNGQLQAYGIKDPQKEVAFAVVHSKNKRLLIDRYKDNLNEKADISDYKGPN